ncbi:MAG: hypothetical protein QOG43_1795 [Actinomycetota bacterium]|jgi:hypothetical protein|nr:hypothetical protein [Actinomycetota bacterium]
MTEPEEGRPGGPDTPPSATPAPPATSPGPEAKGDDTVVPSSSSADPTATPPPAAPTPPVPPPAAAAPPPAPTPTPAPAPAPTPPPLPVPAPSTATSPYADQTPAPAATAVATTPADDLDDLDDYLAPRWVALATTVGVGLIGVVALQVLLTLLEGLSIKRGERFSIPDDLIHRIGYPFGSLGSTAIFFVLLGVLLLALPTILGEEVTDGQYAIAGAALRTALVLGILIGLGSLLAVRGSLHEYSAKNVTVPLYVKVQFTNFLLATLAAAAVTVYGAIATLRLRDEG